MENGNGNGRTIRFKFSPEVQLGSILQIVTIVGSMMCVVWYASTRLEALDQQYKQILARLDRDEADFKEAKFAFVNKEVQKADSQVLFERLEYIGADVQAIKAKIGLPVESSKKFWR